MLLFRLHVVPIPISIVCAAVIALLICVLSFRLCLSLHAVIAYHLSFVLKTRDEAGSGDEAREESAEKEASRSPIMSSPVREEEDDEDNEDDKAESDRARLSSSEDEEDVKPPPKKKRLSRVYWNSSRKILRYHIQRKKYDWG